MVNPYTLGRRIGGFGLLTTLPIDFFTLHANSDGEVREGLLGLMDRLANAPTEVGISKAIEGYCELHDTYYLPEPTACFGTGYIINENYGHHAETLMEGLKTACSETCRRLGKRLSPMIHAFAKTRPTKRAALATEFVENCKAQMSAFEHDLATYEAHMAHPKPLDFVTEHFGKLKIRACGVLSSATM